MGGRGGGGAPGGVWPPGGGPAYTYTPPPPSYSSPYHSPYCTLPPAGRQLRPRGAPAVPAARALRAGRLAGLGGPPRRRGGRWLVFDGRHHPPRFSLRVGAGVLRAGPRERARPRAFRPRRNHIPLPALCRGTPAPRAPRPAPRVPAQRQLSLGTPRRLTHTGDRLAGVCDAGDRFWPLSAMQEADLADVAEQRPRGAGPAGAGGAVRAHRRVRFRGRGRLRSPRGRGATGPPSTNKTNGSNSISECSPSEPALRGGMHPALICKASIDVWDVEPLACGLAKQKPRRCNNVTKNAGQPTPAMPCTPCPPAVACASSRPSGGVGRRARRVLRAGGRA